MSWDELFSNDVTESLNWFGTTLEQSQNSFSSWQEWVEKNFPHVASSPFGNRHIRLWEWFESLEQGRKPDPRVEVWPRGGAKSSTAELGVAFIGSKLNRNYCLYVSETQDQADKHVTAIATLMERAGIDRSINKYGNSKGWRRNQLRASNGFNVESLGLDTAARGIKLDEFRPDLIIFDDIDNREDNAKATAKKERSIKDSIIPAGSTDCAVLFIQNLILEDGVVAKLVDGRADFLLTRDVPPVEAAVIGLEVERYDRGDGKNVYRIIAGEPTWEGQNIETCEGQINEWSLESFNRESQHLVQGADGVFFKVANIRWCPEDVPIPKRFISLARGWDFSSTEGGGDWTVGALLGAEENGVKHKLDVVRGQWSSENVFGVLKRTALSDKEKYGEVIQVLPQDPGQAGKFQATLWASELKKLGIEVLIRPTHGKKALRARNYQEDYNLGNVVYHRGDWNDDDKAEHRRFREDESHEFDDQVDASADAHWGVNRPALAVFV